MKTLTRLPRAATALFTVCVAAGCSSLPSLPSLPSSGPVVERGGAWVGLNGLSLYTYDRDPSDLSGSACTGDCLRQWPPLATDADAVPVGKWYPLKRSDGIWQWTYNGKPVYFHARDRLPGERSGEGAGGTWRLARP